MAVAHFKQDLFAAFARTAAALGNGYRAEIVELLAQAERNVETLADLCGLSVANTSQHLQKLRHGGLVTTRKAGQHVYYRLSGEEVYALLSAVQNVAVRQSAEAGRLIDTTLTPKDALEPVSARVLLKRIKAGTVTVIDVRPAEEFAAGHLPGALHLPLGELKRRLKSLASSEDIVAYCRGPHCMLAFDAVARLRAAGFNARRLNGGLPEWRMQGLPVEASA